MSIALVFALSLFLSTALVPLFIRYASSMGLVDLPDGNRKVHTKVIPRSGGIAIALASILPLAFLTYFNHLNIGLLVGALIIVFFGILDDRYNLHYRWKFSGQILAVAIYITSYSSIGKLPFFVSGEIWQYLSYAILFFFILGVTNAVNLSDGLDGLAGGATLLSLALIAFLAYCSNQLYIAFFAVSVIGALLGFLRFNTHPATVFMGDTGSQYIGFMLAALSVELTQLPENAYSPVLPLLIVGLPIIDTFMVMSIRLREKRSPFSPDKNHIHHQLLKFGLHHYETVATIYLVQIIFIVAAYLLRFSADSAILATHLCLASLTLGVLYFAKLANWQLRTPNKGKVERRNLLFRRLSFFHEYGSQILSITLGLFWALLIYLSDSRDNTVPWLAVISLVTTFALTLLKPKLSPIYTRIAAYSASTLTLYPLWASAYSMQNINLIINSMAAILGVLLLITIRVTRKNNFRLDNQDILVLFILIGVSILPVTANIAFDISAMAIKLALMLYVVEYLINNLKTKLSLIYNISVFCLFLIAIK